MSPRLLRGLLEIRHMLLRVHGGAVHPADVWDCYWLDELQHDDYS